MNAVRVYRSDPNVGTTLNFDASYDKFMQALADHNMYAIVSVTPTGAAPWQYCPLARLCHPEGGCTDDFGKLLPESQNTTCYPSCLLTYGQAVVAKFSKYTNTLAFVIGNEVMNSNYGWPAVACVRSYNRDLKNFMRSCKSSQRYIPTMYAAADDGWNVDHDNTKKRMDADTNDGYKGKYLTCGDDESLRVDIMGYNIYRWSKSTCTFESCNYKLLYDHVKDLGVPVVLTEYGCNVFYWNPETDNKIGQRDWKQVPVVFGAPMNEVFSGGFAYAYGETGGKCDPSGDKPCFAFYSGGDVSGRGPPGNTKVCGYGGGVPGTTVCNVDNYIAQLAAVRLCGSADPTVSCTGVIGTSICNWTTPGYQHAPPRCEDLETTLTTKYDVNLTQPPASRQDAPGYTKVECAVHSLTPVERAISDCQAIPTAYPTLAPTPNPTLAPTPTPAPEPGPPSPTPPPNPSSPTPAPGPSTAAPTAGPGEKSSGATIGIAAGAAVGGVAVIAGAIY